ncbi:MAG: T9SS type A sorting domain-containing protein [Bacteroidales bacterium]|nr:T9SS type A sorting domain-containing protein [Bacteroidales bacterium]
MDEPEISGLSRPGFINKPVEKEILIQAYIVVIDELDSLIKTIEYKKRETMKKFKSMLLVFCFLLANFAYADWTSIQLTDDNYAESMPSIALDSYGNPNFAWGSNDDGDYDIYYLTEITGTPVMVTNNSTEDLYPCLKFDQAGYAHIVYKGYDGHDYEEFYIHNKNGDFCEPIQVSFTSTDVGVFVPDRSSFDIDSAGIIHVVYKYGYYEYGNWDIYYVNNEGGTFGTPIKITSGDKTSYTRPAIALDNNGYVHLVFENGANIIYTNNISGSFDPLEIISVGTIRWHSSIGIDFLNNVHISYAGYHGGVFYINNIGGNFNSTVTISTSNGVNGPTTLVLDHSSNVHIAYIGGVFGTTNTHELYYVNNISGNFEDIEQLTGNDEHTTDISLCVDSLNNCYITYLEGYYGSNDYEVWYITNSEFTNISSDYNNPENIKLSNYPNPFKHTTTISFSLPENTKNTEIIIYNFKGQKIKTFPVILSMLSRAESRGEGQYSIQWDGKNGSGKTVNSGIYFYRLSINGKTKSVNKCLLIR